MYCNSDYGKLIYNKHYDYLSTLSPIKQATEYFKFKLQELPIYVFDDDLLFGFFGFDEIIDTEGFKPLPEPIFTDDEQKIIDFPEKIRTYTKIDKAHTCVNYKIIITKGLIFYESRINEELKKSPDDPYLNAMKSTIDSVCAFQKRIALLIDQKINVANKNDKLRLQRMKNAVLKVPYLPADDFYEALQSIWIIHFLTPMSEDMWCSISLGDFDNYMYPYYKKELENGTDKKELRDLMYNFYKLLNSYCDGACAMNVGGKVYTEFSKFLIECQRDFGFPGPILAARISKETDNEIFDTLIDEKLFTVGQPTFYSEEGCIEALIEKGVPISEAKGFANNSCMGISMPGQEANSMWGCVFTVTRAFEAALTNGCSLASDQVLIPNINSDIKSLDELYKVFYKCCDYILNIALKSYKIKSNATSKYTPNPFLSILTDNCIEKHTDRYTGARYNNATVECIGMINTSDGICAIDRLVFKEKKYTLSEYISAVKNNFEGYDELLHDVLNCSKYGQNSEADKYAVELAETLERMIRKHDEGNFKFSPSLHTLDANVGHGFNLGATFDGRLAKAPIAKNAGTGTNGVRTNDPTGLIMSAIKLPQYKFYGGQPIDIYFDINIVKNKKEQIRTLIRTYLENGGLQFQVNSISPKILREALENPELHRGLIVRVGGYSLYFNQLSHLRKLDFIERFENET